METKKISITVEAYDRLKASGEKNESFTEIINRITKKADIMNFAGLFSEKEADILERNIAKSRKMSSKRMERIRSEFN